MFFVLMCFCNQRQQVDQKSLFVTLEVYIICIGSNDFSTNQLKEIATTIYALIFYLLISRLN